MREHWLSQEELVKLPERRELRLSVVKQPCGQVDFYIHAYWDREVLKDKYLIPENDHELVSMLTAVASTARVVPIPNWTLPEELRNESIARKVHKIKLAADLKLLNLTLEDLLS